MNISKYLLSSAVAIATVSAASTANAFCGFYVAKADTDLFNQSSKVAMVRDGDRTVITMANDYQGDPTEFAMVIPVPTVITKSQSRKAFPLGNMISLSYRPRKVMVCKFGWKAMVTKCLLKPRKLWVAISNRI